MEKKKNKIIRERLHFDDKIIAETVMASDGDSYEDLKPVFQEIAVCPVQTHSINVGIVEKPIYSDETESDYKEKRFEETDALITFQAGISIGIITADCVPILVYAPDIQAVGAIHAGWKGTLGGIVNNVLDILTENGAEPSKLRIFFGPSISQENYEVDEDLARKFRDAGFATYINEINKPHINLQGVNFERFIRRGVKTENIHLHSGCSFSSKNANGTFRYQSHRRSCG